jgi:CRP-like cAMP-binding protein
LACLPSSDRDRILSKLVPNFLKVKTVLFEPGEVVDAVYFPLDGVVSLVTPLEDGAIVEVATIGNEGLVGVPVVLEGSLAVRAISQVAGRSLTMSASDFIDDDISQPAGGPAGAELRAGAVRADLTGRCLQPAPLQ